MKSAPSYMGISRQIILIVLLIMVFITSGLSIVIGVTSFNNLATITLDELQRMSKIFSSQMHQLQQNAVKSVNVIEKSTLLAERLEQLTNLGPYYYSDESQRGQEIEEADKIYTLQAQLEIIQALEPLQNLHQLSSISFYHLSPFDQIANIEPVLNLRMDQLGHWVGQFQGKGRAEQRDYYHVSRDNYQPPSTDFFDVTSVYQLTAADFYQAMKFEISKTVGFQQMFSAIPVKELLSSRQSHSEIVISQGIPVIRTWSVLQLPVSNPKTWEAERVAAMLVVLEQTIGREKLQAVQAQLGIDVALARDNEILVSSLATASPLGELQADQTVTSITQSYYYARQLLDFDSSLENRLQTVVLSPISVLANLTKGLFLQMSLLVVISTLLASIAFYLAIRKLVMLPLNRLMTGVEKISAGDLQHRVQIGSQNELGQLASAFNVMSFELAKKTAQLQGKIEQLKELDQLKDSFLANTSHELRTPLNGIFGIAESMIDGATGKLSQIQIDNLAIIVSSGKRLSSLVNDILDFSKLRYDNLQLQRTTVDVKSVANVVLTLLQTLLGQKDLKLINAMQDNLAMVNADENRLQQILHNLLGNALKFTAAGQITVDADVIDGKMQISITDTGIGIPVDKQTSIFESFEQADGSIDRKYGGTGLGLAITKQLIELHGGEVWLQSTVDLGTTFYFTLPLAAQGGEVLAPTAAVELQAEERVQVHFLSDLSEQPEESVTVVERVAGIGAENEAFCILVVDDEPINLRVIGNHLSLYRYRVKEAISGAQALEFIERGLKPDLILLDVMMPQMNGFKVCQILRQKYSANELPIILVTAKNQATDLIAGFSSGANDYLTKPYSKHELLVRINLHIQLSKSSRELLENETRLQRLADHLHNSNAELKKYQTTLENMVEQRTSKLNEAQKQLFESEKMALLGRLVAGVAHELNTPLGISVTASSALIDKTKKFQGKYLNDQLTREDLDSFLNDSLQATEILLANLHRASQLIDSFKQVAVDQASENTRRFPVLDYVEQVLRTLHPRIKKTRIDIQLTGNSEVIIDAYAGYFSQILTNFIMNSIIHAFPETAEHIEAECVHIDIQQQDQNLILTYSDNGQGMSEQDLARIFDPFFTTRRGHGGTGLGLHIVYNLVTQKFNGAIKCESKLAEGTQFTLTIPLHL
ncbi:MAG: ATP-binding protein [Pseudomonadales bacterium]|nr:ATP-binding protein [Pseudomonadales bacterium]